MKTSLLTKLHNQSIKELELIAKCDERRYAISKRIEAEEKKHPAYRYLLYTKKELQNDYNRLGKIKERLFTWYWQTLNKIMYHSN